MAYRSAAALLALLLLPLALAAQNAGEWRTYGNDGAYTHYTPLDQIDAANVAAREIVWRWLAPAVALLAVVLTTYRAIDDPRHSFWPLALLIPICLRPLLHPPAVLIGVSRRIFLPFPARWKN